MKSIIKKILNSNTANNIEQFKLPFIMDTSMKYLKLIFLLMVIMIHTITSTYPKSPKVVVIGAGIAGLTAAYRLAQKGLAVQVYEAKPRVGGRILTAIVDGHIAELGAQNILDGAPAENIIGLIQELGLTLNHGKICLNPYYVNKDKLVWLPQLLSNKKFSQEELEKLLPQIVAQSKNMREVLNHLLNPEDLVHKALSTMIAGYEGARLENLSTFYTETLMHMLLGGFCSAHAFDTSDDEHYFDHLTITGGNSLLPEALAQKLGDRVHTNMPLKSVNKSKINQYLLIFQDGQEVQADILVFANPCSTYADINFEADIIPHDKLTSIREIQYGTNAKILVPLSGNYQRRVQTLDDEIGTHFNVDETVLTLYCTKDTGFYTAQNIAELYHSKLPHLKLMYDKENLPSSIPTIARDEPFAQYQNPIGHSWPNDPYIKGSYHYIGPEQEEALTRLHEHNGETVKTLFAPINNKIFFAGEHTSILMDIPGTLEAACESGERAARMIKKNIK